MTLEDGTDMLSRNVNI